MSDTNTGGPAFPRNISYPHESGMTLRDYFAAKAMQGLISSLQEGEDFTDRGCEWAYKVADAMLKARES